MSSSSKQICPPCDSCIINIPPSEQFLPEAATTIDELARKRLEYIIGMAHDTTLSPFTQQQYNLIREANCRSRITTCSLRWGLISSLFVSVVFLYVSAFVTAKENSGKKINPYISSLIPLFSVVYTTIVLTYATGFAPDNSSNAFNAMQDTLLETTNIYNDLAYTLIALNYSSEKRDKEIVKQFKEGNYLEILKGRILKDTQNEQRSKLITELFVQALMFLEEERIENISSPPLRAFAFTTQQIKGGFLNSESEDGRY